MTYVKCDDILIAPRFSWLYNQFQNFTKLTNVVQKCWVLQNILF